MVGPLQPLIGWAIVQWSDGVFLLLDEKWRRLPVRDASLSLFLFGVTDGDGGSESSPYRPVLTPASAEVPLINSKARREEAPEGQVLSELFLFIITCPTVDVARISSSFVSRYLIFV